MLRELPEGTHDGAVWVVGRRDGAVRKVPQRRPWERDQGVLIRSRCWKLLNAGVTSQGSWTEVCGKPCGAWVSIPLN